VGKIWEAHFLVVVFSFVARAYAGTFLHAQLCYLIAFARTERLTVASDSSTGEFERISAILPLYFIIKFSPRKEGGASVFFLPVN